MAGGGVSMINKLQEVTERGGRAGKTRREGGEGGDTPTVVKADMILIPTNEFFISCLLGVMSMYQRE